MIIPMKVIYVNKGRGEVSTVVLEAVVKLRAIITSYMSILAASIKAHAKG